MCPHTPTCHDTDDTAMKREVAAEDERGIPAEQVRSEKLDDEEDL